MFHSVKGHSFKVLIFKAVVAGKKRPSSDAEQLLRVNGLSPLSPYAITWPQDGTLLNINPIKV